MSQLLRLAIRRAARVGFVLLSVVAILTVVPGHGAFARPGGGNTFKSPGSGSRSSGSSGGSSRSSSTPSRSYGTPTRSGSSRSSSSSRDRDDDRRSRSSGRGDGQLFVGLIALVVQGAVQHPLFALALLVGLGLTYYVLKKRDGWGGNSWQTSGPTVILAPRDLEEKGLAKQAGPLFGDLVLGSVPTIEKPSRRSELLAAVSRHDPAFSLVLFEDFLYSLYVEAHRARANDGIDILGPYLSSAARASLRRYRATSVETIVVGSMSIEQVSKPPAVAGAVQIVVAFDANYTETDDTGRARSFVTREAWTVERKLTARSKPAGASRVFGCPNCGAPLTSIRGRTCLHCKQAVDTGAYDWHVVRIAVTRREERGSMLGGDTVEVGTHDPTIVDPDAARGWDALVRRDPALTWPGLEARVRGIFGTFHAAWNAQDMMRARAVLSDHLFQAQTFWIDAYRSAGLKNLTGTPRIEVIHPAHVLSDAHFDSVTVRVFATGLDYTIDERGKVVAGSTQLERDYSEYWTLIRSAKRSGTVPGDLDCPNCGGPMDVNMAGQCKHCNARVASGEFDWVLSRIEQDESYEG